MEDINGTITISLKDFKNILDQKEKSLGVEKKFKEVASELEVFLSWLCTRYGVEEHVNKYNMQSTNARILIEDGKAKIEIRNKKNINE
tara:strand:+ start:262 stop:525 length:264 start_codon:yes stop_codon:yes gene_type:complete